MSRRVYYDEDGQPYYELICDACRRRYRCGDDSCYDWRLLGEAAEYDGWNAVASAATGPHHCPDCIRTGASITGATARRSNAPRPAAVH
ncbi:hypothetical protein [Actinocatenispora sera]|uniref:Uncharacterized protein n=1 Tax=Actinocatenispora sera TaxID=390989 RepID=A0A810L311_9ACTN|nr:hypothetical protein [Actinocatenispora sera]BCJ28548.1 hypothetical protein Asera_26560 [Actinocatenispora sera]